ncbi:hypothetical protein BC332_20641 [Capsicum chinense]|nr:hypothetical protein BC332_20641 [Capsicum chinense]
MENEDRTWMYNRLYPNRAGLRDEYKYGVAGFIAKAMTLNDFLTKGMVRCPCWNCKCCKLLSPDVVTLHLYRKEYKNGEKERPFIDVCKEMHRKKNKDGTREVWVKMRAKNAYEEFQKTIEEWCQTQPTSKDGTMFQPLPTELNNMWTTVVGGPKKGRTYGTGDLQFLSSPSLFSSSSSTLQTMEEREVMKKTSIPLKDVSDVINEPQGSDDIENISQVNRRDPLSMTFSEALIACLSHRDNHVFETSLKFDGCL